MEALEYFSQIFEKMKLSHAIFSKLCFFLNFELLLNGEIN